MAEKEQKKFKAPSGFTILLIISLAVVIFVVLGQSAISKPDIGAVSWSAFIKHIEKEEFEKISLDGNEAFGEARKVIVLRVKDQSGKEYEKDFKKVRAEFPPSYFQDAQGYENLRVKAEKSGTIFEKYNPPNYLWRDVLLPLIPWLVIVLIIYFLFFRPMRGPTGQGNVLTFGRIRADLYQGDKVETKFDDVAGIDEAKEEVKELVEFLKNPKKFKKLGGRIPKGVILVGPPGTGKTLLARAIAGEAGVPFFSICGSDFVEMFVGVGAARVRDIFTKGKEKAPCIIFIDEIDAVGRRRGSGLGGGHDEREQTLNQILVEMDGFATDKNILIIASTNRPDILDPALLRPGRFDREVVLDLPDVKGREEILKVHVKKIKLDPQVNLSVLAKTTPMYSGADLAAIVNESAINASMKNREYVIQEDLEEARDKIRWGRQKKSRVIAEEDRKITAYHEGGHALIAELLKPLTEPLHKVTIIPRGPALGVTMTLPERDRYHMHKEQCLANITMLMGGRVSEELFFKDISAGARDDIRKATELARTMVCEWGMSEKLGPVSYGDQEEHLFLGREIARTKPHSEQISVEIDTEIRSFIDSCYNKAKELIGKNREKLEKIAISLLEREVLTGHEVRSIINGAAIGTG